MEVSKPSGYLHLCEVKVYAPPPSISDCQASCEASPTCKSITVGTLANSAQFGECVLCTSDQPPQFDLIESTAIASWATAYIWNNHSCYEGSTYVTQACADCTGPGPSQCTACNEGDALVPWRYNAIEGSCHTYTDVMQVRDFGTSGTLAGTLLASTSTKWGKISGAVSLPAVNTSNETSVMLEVTCYVRKVVMCEARSSIDEALACKVHKEATLASVEAITYSANSVLGAICEHIRIRRSLGHIRDGIVRCRTVPVDEVTQFLNTTSPNLACAPIVKLA